MAGVPRAQRQDEVPVEAAVRVHPRGRRPYTVLTDGSFAFQLAQPLTVRRLPGRLDLRTV